MILYTYYRSTAAYRVRIALNYKKLSYTAVPVSLIEGDQNSQAYRNLNPQGRVPTLIDGDVTLGQSLAIIEYLEEKYPQPTILPKTIGDRAWVRAISNIVACDIHPLNNLSAINYLKKPFQHNKDETLQWYFHWLKEGFDTLEKLISEKSINGEYCFGDSITLADICLIPQIYNAFRFGFPMERYPTLLSINEHCLTESYFEKALPEN